MTKLTVNNQPIQYRMPADTPLLWALRDASNLTGTKYGCDSGECGACTVDVDGRAVPSCQVTIGAMEGTNVTTIEGLSRDRSHPVQQAFAEERVVQCGYCTPGMITRAHRLLQENPSPTEEDVRFGMAGNLCRCTGYQNIVKAILAAASQINASKEAAE